jgi:hypothetical protein
VHQSELNISTVMKGWQTERGTVPTSPVYIESEAIGKLRPEQLASRNIGPVLSHTALALNLIKII